MELYFFRHIQPRIIWYTECSILQFCFKEEISCKCEDFFQPSNFNIIYGGHGQLKCAAAAHSVHQQHVKRYHVVQKESHCRGNLRIFLMLNGMIDWKYQQLWEESIKQEQLVDFFVLNIWIQNDSLSRFSSSCLSFVPFRRILNFQIGGELSRTEVVSLVDFKGRGK